MGMFNQCNNLEEPGLTYDGGFAEYVLIKEKYCYLLNDIVEYYGNKMTAFELGAMIERQPLPIMDFLSVGEGFVPVAMLLYLAQVR